MKLRNNNIDILINAIKIEFANCILLDIDGKLDNAIRDRSYCHCISRCLDSSCKICKSKFQKKYNLPDIHEIKKK